MIGMILIAEVAVTLVWQEPVSALFATRSQAELSTQFEEKQRAIRTELASERTDRRARKVSKLARRQSRTAGVGEALGRIVIPKVGATFTFVEGIDEGSLSKGPGHYVNTGLPGQGGTVGIAGHRTTYLAPFRNIDKLKAGDTIKVKMPYGTFRYEVTRTRIVEPSRVKVLDDGGHEKVVLTACHPLYSAAQRIVVFAKLEQGPGVQTQA